MCPKSIGVKKTLIQEKHTLSAGHWRNTYPGFSLISFVSLGSFSFPSLRHLERVWRGLSRLYCGSLALTEDPKFLVVAGFWHLAVTVTVELKHFLGFLGYLVEIRGFDGLVGCFSKVLLSETKIGIRAERDFQGYRRLIGIGEFGFGTEIFRLLLPGWGLTLRLETPSGFGSQQRTRKVLKKEVSVKLNV
ncbi:unnamed protein product [Allacma fusca]|uniref:Uncharacterized protein n=1 Tax=Allacma fusca TaxID=39272 RepID=A0A8J2JN19_9HEXA|nr:unnamed protein product [Allacma fusca]